MATKPAGAVTIVYGNTNYSMSESGDNGVPMSTATQALFSARYQVLTAGRRSSGER